MKLPYVSAYRSNSRPLPTIKFKLLGWLTAEKARRETALALAFGQCFGIVFWKYIRQTETVRERMPRSVSSTAPRRVGSAYGNRCTDIPKLISRNRASQLTTRTTPAKQSARIPAYVERLARNRRFGVHEPVVAV